MAAMWTAASTELARAGLDQWQYPVKVHNIRAAIDAQTCWLVANAHGELVGTITVDRNADPTMWWPEDHPDDALYLHRMIVTPSAKGCDLGSALMDWAGRRAVVEGCKWIRLDAWRSNPGLQKFYTDRKFELVRTVDDPTGSGACFQRDAAIQLGRGPSVVEVSHLIDG